MADVRTIQKAYALLRDEGIAGVLVGTAALQLLGYEVDAPDIDFLTDGRYPVAALTPENEDYHDLKRDTRIDGTKVDYIGTDAYSPTRSLYFHPEGAQVIAGVPVASLDDVVNLKHWRGRPKDHATLLDLGLHPDQRLHRK